MTNKKWDELFDKYKLEENGKWKIERVFAKQFISDLRKHDKLSLLDEVERRLPLKKQIPPFTDLNQTYEQNIGFNQCLKDVINLLSDMREGK